MLLVVFALPSVLNAAEFETLHVGFQGVAKVGQWLPVKAVVSGLPPSKSVQLRAAFSDPRGDVCVEIVDTAQTDAKGEVSLEGLFKTGRQEGLGQIQILQQEDQRVLCQQSVLHGRYVLPPDEETRVHSTLVLYRLEVPFLATFGEVAGIEELLRNAENYADETSLLYGVNFASTSQLPDTANGLQALNMILLTDDFKTTADQSTAIREWVMKGGRLFVSSGKTVPEFVESELGEWLSPQFDIRSEPINVRDLSSMQSYVSGATTLQTNRQTLAMAVMNSDQTVNEVTSLDGPVVGGQSSGAGAIKFIAVDLNKKPVAGWSSLPAFYEVLFFGKKLSRQSTQESRTSRISQSGISDLATQMMATVDAIPESGRWSTWAIMAMIIVYLLLIGPVDYLLVAYILKRPHFTWVTFPLFIAAGAAGLYAACDANTEVQLNQLHLLDIVPNKDGADAHTQSWMSVSSPQTMRGDLKAEIALPLEESQDGSLDLTWSGRPEDIYGGMYRVGGIGLGQQSYIHDAARNENLTGVPLLTNGSRELLADWKIRSKTKLINSNLSVSGYGLLNGTFSHSLPFPISEWAIMHGNRVYRSRKEAGEEAIAAGQDWDSQADDVYASDLKAFLNASRLIKEAGKSAGNRGMTQIVTPYNAESTDPVYIVTMATFYQAAGGSKYVGLSNSLLGQVELSDTIRMNHAVLIGVAEMPVTNLSIGDSPLPARQSKTIVRLLLPIDRRPSKGIAPKPDD